MGKQIRQCLVRESARWREIGLRRGPTSSRPGPRDLPIAFLDFEFQRPCRWRTEPLDAVAPGPARRIVTQPELPRAPRGEDFEHVECLRNDPVEFERSLTFRIRERRRITHSCAFGLNGLLDLLSKTVCVQRCSPTPVIPQTPSACGESFSQEIVGTAQLTR